MQNCLHVLTHSVTGSVPSNVSELLPHNSSSHFLCSLSHMHILKLQLQNLDCFKFFVTVLWSLHLEDPTPHHCPPDFRHTATLLSFKNKFQTFLLIFQLTSTALHSCQPVQAVCVRLVYSSVDVHNICKICKINNGPYLDAHYVFYVKLFELQGRCFQNFHTYE